jgi:hypothetical protein
MNSSGAASCRQVLYDHPHPQTPLSSLTAHASSLFTRVTDLNGPQYGEHSLDSSTLNLRHHFNTSTDKRSLVPTQAGRLRRFEIHSAHPALCVLCTTPPPLPIRFGLALFPRRFTVAMSSQYIWDSSSQCADKPPQYSATSNLTLAENHLNTSINTFVEKPQLMARMDHPDDFRYEEIIRMNPYTQHAQPIDQQVYHAAAPRQPAIRPTPPTRSSNPPRPREFGSFIESIPHITAVQRTQSIGPGFLRDVPARRPVASRPKRRPRPLDQERLREPSSSAMFYPQMSPYSQADDDDLTHATFDYYPRSVSQPVTPGLVNTGAATHGTYITGSATYGPVVEDVHGNTIFSASEAAFNDEHEFRLFVEATAGLGPIPSMDEYTFASGFPGSQSVDIRASRRAETRQVVSPTAETPNTIQALQHLPQMPQSTHSSSPQRPQLQSFGSNFDNWLQTPPTHPRLMQQHSMPQMSANAPLDSWQDVPETTPIEDELPDYAASQAQAQAAQRVEATRRAQELQRRWQASGSHVMRYG